MKNVNCTCGSAATNSPAHSEWCDSFKYYEDRTEPFGFHIADYYNPPPPSSSLYKSGTGLQAAGLLDPNKTHNHAGTNQLCEFEAVAVDEEAKVILSDESIQKIVTAIKSGALPQSEQSSYNDVEIPPKSSSNYFCGPYNSYEIIVTNPTPFLLKIKFCVP